jgi:flavin reductase (DIM6/NTAB) family NADH-FMN oxidoreductase RutF
MDPMTPKEKPMTRLSIAPDQFLCAPFHQWNDCWFLLCAGTLSSSRFNIMTVAWGGFGVLWSKPVVWVAVRPSRYTYEFMERYESFTLSAFPAAFQPKLSLCGSKSGREINKVEASGLTPIPSSHVEAPGFDEAELILECRKIHFEDLNPDHFLDQRIEENYNGSNYHRLYTGEVLAISGTPAYQRR